MRWAGALLVDPGNDLFCGFAGLGPGEVFGAVAEGEHRDNAFSRGVDDAVFSQEGVGLVCVEAFDGAGVNADESGCGHHVAQGDIGLLGGPVEKGAVGGEPHVVDLEALVGFEGFSMVFGGEVAGGERCLHVGAVVLHVAVG